MKLNLLSKGLLLIVISLSSLQGQTRFPVTRNHINGKEQERESRLQLTMKIASTEYCVGDSELDGLRLKVRLIYTNKANTTLFCIRAAA